MNATEVMWTRLAQRTAFRVTLCRALHAVAPLIVIFGGLSVALGILGRHYFAWKWTVPMVLVVGMGMPFLLVGVILLWSFKNRTDHAEGIVRLDLMLGLNNALTAASAGRCPWPKWQERPDDRLRFNWGRILAPVVICVCLAAAGLFIPLPADSFSIAEMPRPRSHEEMAAAIAELDKLEILRKEDVTAIRRQLDELIAQPSENWYIHSSLEAADHLKASLQKQLRGLAQNLLQARVAITALDSSLESTSASERQRRAQEFKSALQELKNASPGLNEGLTSALFKIDPANLKSPGRQDLERPAGNAAAGMGVVMARNTSWIIS